MKDTHGKMTRIAVSVVCALFLIVSTGPASAACFSGPAGKKKEQILTELNRERQRQGLSPLVCDGEVEDVAQGHADDMARRGYFDHYTPEGLAPTDRLDAAGITYSNYGENIAWGSHTAKSVVSLWMGSPGHRANILDNYTAVGIGVSGNYYVLVFVRK